jgi:hypothetical protein
MKSVLFLLPVLAFDEGNLLQVRVRLKWTDIQLPSTQIETLPSFPEEMEQTQVI